MLSGWRRSTSRSISASTSGTGALLTSVQPLATGVLRLVLYQQRLAIQHVIGIALGLAGVYLVVAEDVALLSAPFWAYALPLVSVAAIAVSYVLEKGRGNQPDDAPQVIALPVRLTIQFAASAILLILFAAAEGFRLRPNPAVLFAFGWQIVMQSIASYGLMWVILDRSDAMHTSALIPLMPPVTLAMSALFLSEPIGPVKLLAFVVATVGVAMMRTRMARKTVEVAE